MSDKPFVTESHQQFRGFFRVIGPLLMLGGATCMVIAGIDFFTLSPFESPSYFWLFFVAIPILFVGFVLSGLGYGGAVARYQSKEYAPVAKDTFNYMAKGTTEGVKSISGAFHEGKQSISQDQTLVCSACQTANEFDSKFCQECGDRLQATCEKCNTTNDRDAKFCDQCGYKISV